MPGSCSQVIPESFELGVNAFHAADGFGGFFECSPAGTAVQCHRLHFKGRAGSLTIHAPQAAIATQSCSMDVGITSPSNNLYIQTMFQIKCQKRYVI